MAKNLVKLFFMILCISIIVNVQFDLYFNNFGDEKIVMILLQAICFFGLIYIIHKGVKELKEGSEY